MSSEADPQRRIRIAIFASGRGSNAHQMFLYFKDQEDAEIVLVVTNKPDAGVLHHAHNSHCPALVITRKLLNNREFVISQMKAHRVDFIILAGFLLLLPEFLVNAYPGRIINIHPALLPRYGGKGMYGMHVHRAVKNSGDQKTGITIHYVNEAYDEGAIIFQKDTIVHPSDTPEEIAEKVHELEHAHYPAVAHRVIRKQFFTESHQSDT